MKNYVRLLTIAGSDSGGGAGIQADLKTFSALGCYGMSVITALTAQNTVGVDAIYSVTPKFVREQFKAVITDIGTSAIKIGMLGTPELVETVAKCLQEYNCINIVLDPVMVAKSGDKLLPDESIASIIKNLIPLADIITPNMMEAELLTNIKIVDNETMIKAAKRLVTLGAKNVIIKGSFYRDSSLSDLFIDSEHNYTWLEDKRVDTINNHGTGCTLSSAIASYIGKGYSIKESVIQAKRYITESIDAGANYQLGKGKSPVNHFYKFWK